MKDGKWRGVHVILRITSNYSFWFFGLSSGSPQEDGGRAASQHRRPRATSSRGARRCQPRCASPQVHGLSSSRRDNQASWALHHMAKSDPLQSLKDLVFYSPRRKAALTRQRQPNFRQRVSRSQIAAPSPRSDRARCRNACTRAKRIRRRRSVFRPRSFPRPDGPGAAGH